MVKGSLLWWYLNFPVNERKDSQLRQGSFSGQSPLSLSRLVNGGIRP